MTQNSCPLCFPTGEDVVVNTGKFRVIRVHDENFPGYFRIIWNEHIKEMSDLSVQDRHDLADAICAIEKLMIEELKPAKVNLAEFGTMVPHLHWHLIARYEDDPTFPDSYWSNPKRSTPKDVLSDRQKSVQRCAARIAALFA